MKKILLSLSLIVAVGAVVVGATTAFYNDTETSAGNVLAAGAIDLGIDNESYYNGTFNEGTSWALDYDMDDQEVPHLFFNFNDLKPGDWGEDTISLHVNNNDAYLCADITLTSNNDNGLTEPEGDVDSTDGVGNGELASHVNFYWWADDGDNVLETCNGYEGQTPCVPETLLPGSGGNFAQAGVGNTSYITLADSNYNVWTGSDSGALPANSPVIYLGKAWCFGTADMSNLPVQDGGDQGRNPSQQGMGIDCDGTQEGNETQTDSITVDIAFRAEQARHNDSFVCQPLID